MYSTSTGHVTGTVDQWDMKTRRVIAQLPFRDLNCTEGSHEGHYSVLSIQRPSPSSDVLFVQRRHGEIQRLQGHPSSWEITGKFNWANFKLGEMGNWACKVVIF